MPTPLIVNGVTYEYPVEGDSPPWGEEATDWAIAVTNVLESVNGSQDILSTIANIANNQTSPTPVVGLAFNPTAVYGAIVTYAVYRVTTGGGAEEEVEVGFMYISYKPTAAVWDIAVAGGNNADVNFTMNSGGQVLYTSSNMTGSGYSGTITFSAKSITN